MDKEIQGTVSLKEDLTEQDIDKMEFSELKSLFESWDLSQISEYNIPDYENDSIMILRAKALIIHKKKSIKEREQ